MLKSIYVFMFGLLTSLLHSAGAPVYIVGVQVGKTPDATLWITDTSGSPPKAVVLGNPNEDSVAYSLTAISNKLFCIGKKNTGSGDIATLWITDPSGSSAQAVELNNFIFSNTISFGQLPSFNNKIFYCGTNKSSEAALLIFDTSNQSQSIIPLSTETNSSNGLSVTYANNKIYCVGKQYDGTYDFATLWITDTSGKILNVVTLDNTQNYSQAYSLAASNSNIYCLGEVNGDPTLWITDADGSNCSKISLKNITDPLATAITVKNNLLYILSFDNQDTTSLKMTILNTTGTLIKSVALGGSNGSAIQSLGNQICAVGYQGKDADIKATLWVTDTTGSSVSSYTIAPSPSAAFGVYIPQQETPTFYQALQKFSPVHFQKGI